jgi:hypothetical protein
MSAVVMIAIVVAALYFMFKLSKERAAAFAASAPQLGFTYAGNESPFEGTDVDGLHLLTKSHRHKFRNVLVGKGGSPVVVPQFQYRLFTGKSGENWVADDKMQTHTIIAYRVPHGAVPKFQLYSRGVFGNMGMPLGDEAYRAMRGKGGLDLGNEAFAARFVVVAEDGTAVRMAFSPFLMRALLEQPEHTWLHVQSSADWLLFYDPMIRIFKPEHVAPALARIGPIAEQLLGRAPAAA